MKRRALLKYASALAPLLLFVGFSLYFFVFSTPEKIAAAVGVTNGYVFISILAFLGGLTTFSGIPYHLILVTLALGGLNPFLLGFATSVGVMLGDSTSYYVGYQGRAIVPRRLQNIFQYVYSFTEKYPKALPVFCLFYGSFVPFSNDFITISAGLARYPFWRVMIPLAVGNTIFNISLAYFAPYAYDFLQGIIS